MDTIVPQREATGQTVYMSRLREIRHQAGHFSDATAQNFISVSPKLHEDIAHKLAESFYEEKQK